jgi:hypothetical protein
MTSVNPGPAITSNPNSQLVTTPQNQGAGINFNTTPQGSNALRLIASARGMSVGVTGDAAVLQPINAASYSVANVIVTNSLVSGASGSIAAGALGVFTAANAGGTAIVANATLTGVTGNTVVSQRTVASTAAIGSNFAGTGALYVNVGTAVANGTCDVFVYGYDLS